MDIVEVDCTAGAVTRRPLTVVEAAQRKAEMAAQEPENARQASIGANAATLRDRASKALTANAAYLTKVTDGTATNADHTRQIALATRECSALIRLLLHRLESIDGA